MSNYYSEITQEFMKYKREILAKGHERIKYILGTLK